MKKTNCKIIDPQTVRTSYEDRGTIINVKSIFTGKKKYADLIVPAIIDNLKKSKAQ